MLQLPSERTTAQSEPQPAQVIVEEGSEESLPQVLDDEDNGQNAEANGFTARLSWNVSAEGDVLTDSVEDVRQSQKVSSGSAWEEGENSPEEMSREEGSDEGEGEEEEGKGEEDEGIEEWRSRIEIKQL